jgi:hypothetical protein
MHELEEQPQSILLHRNVCQQLLVKKPKASSRVIEKSSETRIIQSIDTAESEGMAR